MDETALFADLKPPPPGDLAGPRSRARARLDSAITPGRPHRRRRLALGLSAVAAAACAAVVVPSVLLGGGGTTAYAVTRNSDGTVTVTFSDVVDAKDAAGLQAALRAEGVPALVWAGSASTALQAGQLCRPPASNLEPWPVQQAVIGAGISPLPADHAVRNAVQISFVIHPSAMPRGSVLYFARVTVAPAKAWSDGRLITEPGTEVAAPEVLKHDRLPC